MNNTTLLTILALVTLFGSPALRAQSKTEPKTAAKAADKLPVLNLAQSPDVAAPRYRDGQPDEDFIRSHERYVAIAKSGGVDVLFLGDSITARWRSVGKEIWEKSFASYKAANFGIPADRTQHVLWRITHGEFDGIQPKVVVLMIGTNNGPTASDDAASIARGVTAIVKTILAKSPSTKVLLLGIFPRGSKPVGTFGPLQGKLKEINAILAKLHDGMSVHYLDIGEQFLTSGVLKSEIMPDFLHLSKAGYQIWADAITPKLAELMK